MPKRPLSTATLVDRLAAAGCVAASEEAKELSRAAPDPTTLELWVRRRETGEPLAWITGRASFCGRSLSVAPGVYVPRPQSEELARRAVGALLERAASGVARPAAADLCTGSGAIAQHMMTEVMSADVVGVDLDQLAVRCARANGVHVLAGDLGKCLRPARFDVVTAVAPYVPSSHMPFLPSDVRLFEPTLALDGGADGLDVVRAVVACAATLLCAGGWLLVEVGGDQDVALCEDLEKLGFSSPSTWDDSEGDLRGLCARRTA